MYAFDTSPNCKPTQQTNNQLITLLALYFKQHFLIILFSPV